MTIIIHSSWREQESRTVWCHLPSFAPHAHTVTPDHLKTRLELHEWLKMDIMNLMKKPTTFHHPSGTFTDQTRFSPPAWRLFYSMADSTLRDGILMGIKSKAAPVTVALSQSVCQPLSTLDQLCVCVCALFFKCDANVWFCWILESCQCFGPI